MNFIEGRDHNYISHDHDELDLKLFNGEPVKVMPSEWSSMAQVVADCGFFSSVGEAKRNGWAIPIPDGWSEFKLGKGKKTKHLFIFNPKDLAPEDE